jgi:transposase
LRPTAKTPAEAVQATSEAELARLHAKIGQLVIEKDILSKTFGR